MRKLLLLSLLFLTGCTQIGATRTFVSEQVGDNPQNGYILSTNGATSTWIANSGGPGGDSTIDSTEVAFGSPDNTVTSSANFTFNSSTNQLSVSSITSTSVTSTNLAVYSTSTFYNDIVMAHAHFLTAHGIKGDASDGLYITANNDTAVANFGVGNSANSTFNGAVNIDGQTRLATSLTGLAYLTSGVVSATNTINVATGTITGGFFQTDFTDCDADNQTVAYDVTTGKFGCGDDDSGGAATVSLTNTLIPFGNTDNTLTSSTALSYVTSTNRLVLTGTVSSTNALFWNTTSTNLFSTGLSFTNLSGTNATTTNLSVSGLTSLQGLTFTNGTSTNFFATLLQFTNLNGTNATTTNLFATNANFTRATSTDFFATNASFTSITSTNLSFTRAVGTNVTSTNLSISGLTSLAGLTFTNATGTGQFRIATTTITGGFFQTDLANCNADTETVSYNATTGKFGCGDDDSGGASTVSTTNANGVNFTDVSPASFADNNTTELWNDATRPNITPQSANNPVIINVNYMLRGASATDNDFVIRVVRENDPGSTTPTCDLTSDVQVGASSSGGSLISAFTTNLTDIQSANGMLIDFPATTTAVYYTICTSASSTVSAAPTSSVLHVGLTEIQGAGSGPAREYTQFYTASTTWTKPVTSTGFVGVRAWCVGGGGGGGGAGTADRVGGGGGGGGAAFEYIPAASLTSTAVVTVGVAGTAGAAGNNDGVAGGTSSFGTFITCTGGGGGNDGNSGSTGGAGGTGSGGDFNANGRAGTDPGLYTDSYRGYGGCAGCNYGDPTSIQDSLSNPMAGSGLLGMYAGGAAAKVPSWSAASYTGGTGSYFGAGGGGGQKAGGGADAAGGAGRQGVVVIVELYN